MKIWRIAGVALMAGLALFLIAAVVKLMVIVLVTGLIIRIVGPRLARRFMRPAGRVGWQSTEIISIDNPAYRSPVNRAVYDRIIPIS